MAVSEGWWAEQCSWLTMTLYDWPAVLWMLKDPLSRDSTPDNHGLDTYLKCVTFRMSAIIKTMNETKTAELQAPCDVVLARALHFLVLHTRLPMVGRQLHGHAET